MYGGFSENFGASRLRDARRSFGTEEPMKRYDQTGYKRPVRNDKPRYQQTEQDAYTPETDAVKWSDQVDTRYCLVSFGQGVANKVLDPDIANSIETQLREKWPGIPKYGFPGSLAVSMTRRDFKQLKSQPYQVQVKSDGVRYLMLLTIHNGFPIIDMYDRFGSHYQIGLTWNEKLFKGITIFDGELVKLTDGSYEYQIFDCICAIGSLFDNKPYTTRLLLAANLVHRYYKSDPTDAFSVIVKKPIPPEIIPDVFLHLAEPLFPVDGLVFVPELYPYRCNKDPFLLKYKKTEDHTIDFLLRLKKVQTRSNSVSTGLGIDILEIIDSQAFETRVAFLVLNKEDSSDLDYLEKQVLTRLELLPFFSILGVELLEQLDGLIVECIWDSIWKPKQLRMDKSVPNSISTYILTLLSIKDNISVTELVELLTVQSTSLIKKTNCWIFDV